MMRAENEKVYSDHTFFKKPFFGANLFDFQLSIFSRSNMDIRILACNNIYSEINKMKRFDIMKNYFFVVI